MTVEQSVPILLAGAAGLGLGLIYFGGLWLTIRQLPHTRSPLAMLLVSLILRSVILMLGFYLVMGTHWERAIACLVGVMLVRMSLMSRLRPERILPDQPTGSPFDAGPATGAPGGQEVVPR